MKLAKGSGCWIIIPFFLSLSLFLVSLITGNILVKSILFFLSLLMIFACIVFLVFFRDPERKTGKSIVASADGTIREIDYTSNDEKEERVMISTFMNIYNVHVNRMPMDGVIKDIVHITGGYLPAFSKESSRNERVIMKMDTSIGEIKIIQIAGTLARRIVPYLEKGERVKKGERIGIIRLGSRVDVYLPKKVKVKVEKGDFVKAGSDTIAEIDD
ncbi:MAG: phosphatidylserine decarboxylase [Candidatus Thermoplasmatota archaeon]